MRHTTLYCDSLVQPEPAGQPVIFSSGVRSGPLFCSERSSKAFWNDNKLALRERQWRAQQASQTLSGYRPPSTNKH